MFGIRELDMPFEQENMTVYKEYGVLRTILIFTLVYESCAVA